MDITICEILSESDKHTEQDIKIHIAAFMRVYDNIPQEIKSVDIAASYNMGWQGKGTGKVFDSLLGHVFFHWLQTGRHN